MNEKDFPLSDEGDFQPQSKIADQNEELDPLNQRKLKPHEKAAPDFSHLVLQTNEDTSDQAPLVVVVQGSKNVKKIKITNKPS